MNNLVVSPIFECNLVNHFCIYSGRLYQGLWHAAQDEVAVWTYQFNDVPHKGHRHRTQSRARIRCVSTVRGIPCKKFFRTEVLWAIFSVLQPKIKILNVFIWKKIFTVFFFDYKFSNQLADSCLVLIFELPKLFILGLSKGWNFAGVLSIICEIAVVASDLCGRKNSWVVGTFCSAFSRYDFTIYCSCTRARTTLTTSTSRLCSRTAPTLPTSTCWRSPTVADGVSWTHSWTL